MYEVLVGEQFCVTLWEMGQTIECHDSLQPALEHVENLNKLAGHDKSGVMIALTFTPQQARTLFELGTQVFPDIRASQDSTRVRPGGLHITLCYLGETSDIPVAAEVLAQVAADLAESTSPLSLKIGGAARFAKETDEGTSAVVFLVDSEAVRELYESIADTLAQNDIPYAREHDYTPHITFAYVPTDMPLKMEQVGEVELTADRLALCIGSQRMIFQMNEIATEEVTDERDRSQESFDGYHLCRAAVNIRNESDRERLLRDKSLPVPFTASTEGVKKDGKDLKMDDWDLSRYRRYGPVLWVHDYWHPTIGRGVAHSKEALDIDVYFDEEDDFAQGIRRKSINGMMMGSVGWDEYRTKAGRTRNELIEFSMVPL